MAETALRELDGDPSSRKGFLKGLGGAGSLGAFGLLLAGCGDDEKEEAQRGGAGSPQEIDSDNRGGSDLEVINFALTLEYLEADFYDQALTSGLLSGDLRDLAAAFGKTEQAHVQALEAVASQLGEPVDPPRTDFSAFLEGEETLLAALADVENLGAAAYLGAAPAIQDRELLAAALSIHSVEARHAAALNERIGRSFDGETSLAGSMPHGAFASPLSMQEVMDRVQPFLAS
ncbi:MAG TPA: ferritin-like domain-containing protein [Solirubrobacteraceae bacterium]|nr:ferritin-like domain-containing protein [Solirubrobacteraceae bacterium]